MFIKTSWPIRLGEGEDSARVVECSICRCKAYELVCFTKRKVYIKQVAMHAAYNAGEIDAMKVIIKVCPFELDARHKLLEKGDHYIPETALAMRRDLAKFQSANSFYNSAGPILEYIGIEKISWDAAWKIPDGGLFFDETRKELAEKLKKLFKLLKETDNWTVDQIYINAKGGTK